MCGGHTVNGSEGKINPAFSLHNYLKVKPEVISYNFACRLEEYGVNSETVYVIHNQEHLILLRYFSWLQSYMLKKISAEQMSQEHVLCSVHDSSGE